MKSKNKLTNSPGSGGENTGAASYLPCTNIKSVTNGAAATNPLLGPGTGSGGESVQQPHKPHISLDKYDEFQFKVPPEAPVFEPSEEDFKNPLIYINKIRPIAEKYGICKIRPPASWQPPFTVDVEKLTFVPRVQRLNELEAETRIKLNFLDQIAKFWELQGSSLKIPMVERKPLDLYTLHKVVNEEGGIEVVTKERKWSRVACRMGYQQGKNVGTNLKAHYERILYPFDIYRSGKIIDLANLETEQEDCEYKPHSIEARQQIQPPPATTARRSQRFAQMNKSANQFKSNYFNMPVHLVPTELVEKEFWRIVSSIDEDVTVEYGADLHTMDHGSGFPTKSSLYLLPEDQEYAESSWNLNNLPVLDESILGHINADISGMKVPWMYVGMCFATFCWHNEDHWSYSINYLHWGEPKTWYGVPGTRAEEFEVAMKSAAPELFQSQPDLLHQLVTIMNPNILMNANVPVYRTDQHAGEFIVTFPRAYHAGFNQGYNFAEAVNFAPADWMKMGRECVNHYSKLRRYCVFSHDELVCKMALEPDRLNLGIATACYIDMAEMVDTEKKLRKNLLEWGVTNAEREAFELLSDDARQCEICKTTCFLSAVTCKCTTNLACLRHFAELCECPPENHTLKYRYTLDELPLMVQKLKVKAESFEKWLFKVRDVLDPAVSTNITLDELQEIAQEAETQKFPNSVILERLNFSILEAQKCITVIQQLDINKIRTRTRNSVECAKYKLTLEELDMFVNEINNLRCIIREGDSVRELQKIGKEWVKQVESALKTRFKDTNIQQLTHLIEEGNSLCIELPQIVQLKDRLAQYKWYKQVRLLRENTIDRLSLDEIKRLLDEGMKILPHTVLEKELAELHGIMLQIVDWEQSASQCFKTETQHKISEIENLLDRAHVIEDFLPSHNQLRDALQKSKEWLHAIESLERNENYNFFHTLQNIANRAKLLPMEEERQQLFESMGADSEGKLSLSSFGCIDTALSSGLKRKKLANADEVIKKIKEDPCITEVDEKILKAQILCWNDKGKVSALSMSRWYTSMEEKFGESKIAYHCGKCSEIARKKRIKQYQEEKREFLGEQFKPDLDIKVETKEAEEDEQEVQESFDDFEEVDNEYEDQISDPDNETDQDSDNSHDDDEEAAGDAFIGDSEDSNLGNEHASRSTSDDGVKNSGSTRLPGSSSYGEEAVHSNVTSQQAKGHKQKLTGGNVDKGDPSTTATTSTPVLDPRGVIF
ncbi:hypothetical protein RP20_CCG000730 [Aedes albopictus]|nr:hypothetical protein RP20_CCG000730 [Aedes albopictus]